MQERKFSPHSEPLNSFRTTVSHQSLLHTCIQSICLVYCGINGASLFVYSCEKKGPKKTFLSKSWKRDAVRVRNWSNMKFELQLKFLRRSKCKGGKFTRVGCFALRYYSSTTVLLYYFFTVKSVHRDSSNQPSPIVCAELEPQATV